MSKTKQNIITVAIIAAIFIFPVLYYRYTCKLEMENIETLRITFAEVSEVERAAILPDVIKYNTMIKQARIANEYFIYDIFIPDEFCEIEYIRF